MTRDELVRAVKVRLRIGDSGEGVLHDEVLVEQVDAALRKFSRDRRWPWLLTEATVTIGIDGKAPVPADFAFSRQVVIDNAVAEFVGFDEWVGSDGRYVWTDDGTQLRFDPAPDASFTATLHYHRFEPTLTEGDDSPVAPDAYHDLIVIWAARLGANIKRDYDLAGVFSNEYDRELARMSDDKSRKKGQRHRVTRRDEMNRSRAVW